jgi:hypothetical protein
VIDSGTKKTTNPIGIILLCLVCAVILIAAIPLLIAFPILIPIIFGINAVGKWLNSPGKSS